ncbi:periplasmic component of the Tol biopolymer transport system [Candidatus Methanoperedens nitroreducens]|uniref:Periplasmic component of the Tol biopolymer transport system n=1 Tax=Candidatus Methanoperedens nitratireducens TaxID=1392998 RepID=A0A062VBX4_9EURY|nr:PD40 domain-containing protein [Candidatus Methanoperedens nitroreducens]KCZ72800.1 periplasmic component of the Tol biopolymer transport system [Candidatus Methanoperedens nitroreducens]MDJ1423269.1 PD40 domain-containing protein [Candidatus Methanoperedens sp.]
MRYLPYCINRSILILFLLIFLIPNVSGVAVTNITQLTYGTDTSYGNPAWSPDGKKIVLNKNEIIHTMNVDGSNITSTGQNGYYAKWFPDGSKIVFEWGNSVYIMNSDGSNQKMLISVAGSPSISQDGQYIAFDGGAVKGFGTTPEQGRGIFIIDINGTNIKRLTDDFGDEIMPSWSPNSQKIVFTKNGIINIMDADGSNMTSTGQQGIYARWSPDGKYIAFLSSRAGDLFQGMNLEHIYVMDVDGTNVTQLTFGDDRWDKTFDWSPDGTKIVFTSEVPPTAPKTINNIYIMTLDFNVTSPTTAPTVIQTPTITQTATTTATQTPGFSLLLALASLSILVLIRKIER